MRVITSIVLLAVILSSCAPNEIDGIGGLVTKPVALGEFSNVELSVPAKLIYSQDEEYSIEVVAQENIISVLDFQKTGNRLSIGLTKGFVLGSFKPIRIMITSPDISDLVINGAGEIIAESSIRSALLTLQINGSGKFEISQVDVTKIIGTINGSGNIAVAGGASSEEELSIIGSGNINFSGMQSQQAKVSIGGSGNIRVNASQKLDVTISGSGSVYYKGSPDINTSISGSGKLIKLN